MLAMILISLCASVSFRSIAKKKGYENSRFWAYPLIVGAVIITFSFLLNTFVGLVSDGGGIMDLYPFVVSILALLVQCAVIGKAWKSLKGLPDKIDNPHGHA